MNPYQPPAYTPRSSAGNGFRWKRTIAWALLIYAAVMTVGFLSGMTMARWDIYGSTIEEAVERARLVRRIVYGVVSAFLYWRFAAAISGQRALHIAVAFLVVQLIDIGVSTLIFGDSIQEWFDLWSLGRSLLAAAAGLAIASIRFKPSDTSGR
ncbi:MULTISPECIES: hypothetical protein [unclassified Lysobacter]|uniref:hypothetical protein n=1 Tax=unclassified Lysobacter TaxID=2635362 RepID=UPI0012FCBFE6|nr:MULTISPECIES: hypothetical protein [unclassified Lysobacter]